MVNFTICGGYFLLGNILLRLLINDVEKTVIPHL